MHAFTADTVSRDARRAVALEPMECMADAFNRPECAEAMRLEPGAERRFRCGVEIESVMNALPSFEQSPRRRRAHRAARAGDPVLRSAVARRAGRRRAALQVREPAARRRVQVPRRLQRGVVARRRAGRARRGHAFLRQPRHRAGAGCAPPAASPRTWWCPRARCARKLDAIERAGAILHRCAPTMAAREATCAEVQRATGAELVHPYADPRVMAGQGTAALELLHASARAGCVITPVGGGGLAGGVAIAAHAINPALEPVRCRTGGRRRRARSRWRAARESPRWCPTRSATACAHGRRAQPRRAARAPRRG